MNIKIFKIFKIYTSKILFNKSKSKFFSFVLILFLIHSTSSLIFSQPTNWQKPFRNIDNMSKTYGYSCCKADGQNIYFLSFDTHLLISSLWKINTYGDSLFRIDLPLKGFKILPDDNGGVIMTGRGNTLRINMHGDFIWQIPNPYLNIDYQDIINTTDGNFLICGEPSVFAVDINGNIIKSKLLPTQYKRWNYSIVEDNQRNYFISGEITDGIGMQNIGIITKTDSLLNIIWEKRYFIDNNPSNSIRYPKLFKIFNTIYAGGYFYDTISNSYQCVILKIDNNGNLLTTKKLLLNNNSEFYFYPSDFKVFNNNKFIVAGCKYSYNTSRERGFAFISDSSGNILNYKEYLDSSDTKLYGIFTNDTKIYFSGNSVHYTLHYNLYGIKTDSSLNSPYVFINNTNDLIPNLFILHQNYPNPFNSSTQIQFGIRNKGQYNMKIYDITGKLVNELFNQVLDPGEYKIMFDASNYSSGVYFYKLESSNNVTTKKLVLLK